ncbi:MAG: protein kinase [Myxococcales bacterium]|nr:protein kinase [Myxococcales bacterium]
MDLIGTHIGSYVATKKLGAGGMGTVYLCHHTMIDRDVAVKVLHDEHALDAEQIERFFQEARAAAEIGHPNIIIIIDAGFLATAHGQRAYMMMEALEGDSLDKVVRKGGLDLAQIRHIMEQCASALTASHGKGIIHRDLKPANIFLCHHAFDPLFVKILDFGIAKLTTPQHQRAHKTQFGIVLGTPAYMSPEQCEGKGAIDHRSDIYSLGVVLYELLTGTVPFEGEIRDILLAHLQRRPDPPTRRNPMVPPAWEALCLRMLEIHKEDRPQSMQEVVLALEDLERHAAIYAAAQATRAASGHSGHTMIARADSGVPHPVVDPGSRPTVRDHLDELMTPPSGSHAPPSGGHVPPSGSHVPPSGGHAPPSGGHAPPSDSHLAAPAGSGPHVVVGGQGAPVNPVGNTVSTVVHPSGPVAVDAIAAHCGALVTEHRFDRFPDFLLRQAAGEWLDVGAVCHAVGVERPPPGADVRVAWLEHPYRDARLASIVFFCPATLWSAVLVHRRPG